jgi:oxygen-independent coproporphyrinogen-3 oxidase
LIDPAVVARHRTRAPRYTSYPAAPHFRPLAAEALASAWWSGEGPLSLYVHLPFGQSLCWYCGCHVEVRRRTSVAEAYVERVLAEARLVQARLRPGRLAAQLHLGGGTPTFPEPAVLRRLVRGLEEIFPPQAGVERSIEVDPRTIDVPRLEALLELGFQRFSFGVQDFDVEVMAGVHRPQAPESTESALAWLRARAPVQSNFDLLYGLPGQTVARFERTVDRVIGLRPDRISVFPYAHVPWLKPAQRLLERQGLPDPELRGAIFAATAARLLAAGYQRIGMDHFALPGDALAVAWRERTLTRGFQGYQTGATLDLIGLGVSAIGSFGSAYAQNVKGLARWEQEVDAGRLPVERGFLLSADDRLRRSAILALLARFELRWAELDHPDPRAALADAWPRLEALAADGLLEVHPWGLRLPEEAWAFARNAAAAFDAYLVEDGAQPRYSATH